MRLDSTVIAGVVSAIATVTAAWLAGRRAGPPLPERPGGSGLWLPESVRDPRRPGHERWPVNPAALHPVERVWQLVERLAPLARKVHPWRATALGFLFGGVGVAAYFRTGVDVLIGVLLAIPLALYGSTLPDDPRAPHPGPPWWLWASLVIAAIYAFLRAESSNRRR